MSTTYATIQDAIDYEVEPALGEHAKDYQHVVRDVRGERTCHMDEKELEDILAAHRKWLDCEDGGERADLRNADLRHADLRNADLSDADLRDADLRDAKNIPPIFWAVAARHEISE